MMFNNVYKYIFKLSQLTPDDQLSNISDLLEVFYSFSAHIVKKLPEAFSNPNIDCIKVLAFGRFINPNTFILLTLAFIFPATRTLSLPEHGAVKCAISFICHFVMNSRNYINTTLAMMDRGPDIIKTTLLCIGVRTPRTQVDVFADIFLSCNKKYVSEMAMWLKILEVHDFPAPGILAADKEQFMKAVLREMTNKRLMQGLIRTFAAKCRGLPNKL